MIEMHPNPDKAASDGAAVARFSGIQEINGIASETGGAIGKDDELILTPIGAAVNPTRQRGSRASKARLLAFVASTRQRTNKDQNRVREIIEKYWLDNNPAAT